MRSRRVFWVLPSPCRDGMGGICGQSGARSATTTTTPYPGGYDGSRYRFGHRNHISRMMSGSSAFLASLWRRSLALTASLYCSLASSRIEPMRLTTSRVLGSITLIKLCTELKAHPAAMCESSSDRVWIIPISHPSYLSRDNSFDTHDASKTSSILHGFSSGRECDLGPLADVPVVGWCLELPPVCTVFRVP